MLIEVKTDTIQEKMKLYTHYEGLQVIDELLLLGEYAKVFELKPKTVIDIGAHIGVFTVMTGKYIETTHKKAQPYPDYLRLLAGARYAVNPSRWQAYSIFVVEALAMGVPAVVTPEATKNLPDISCGIDKSSTPTRSYEELERVLNWIMANSEIRKSLLVHSPSFRHQFSWDKLAEKYELVLASTARR